MTARPEENPPPISRDLSGELEATPYPANRIPLYTTAEVAALFAVDPGTVKRWAREGRIPAAQMIVTPGGRRRFDGEYIRSLLAGDDR